MVASELISVNVPPLRCSDSGPKALNIMESYRISHIPLVRDDEYIGLISDKDIYDLSMDDVCIAEKKPNLIKPFVFINQHIFEVVNMMNELDITVLPVLDYSHNYVGMILQNTLAAKFTDLIAVHEPGAVIVLEMPTANYYLSEIARIIESNDARILSLYISNDKESSMMFVTIKVNIIDVSSIIQTFVRFDYVIKAVYMDDSKIKDMYADRFDQFMKYLTL